jgi:hypothetical protein
MSHFHADTGIMRRGERGNDELRMEDLGDSAANKSPIEQVSYEFDPATGPTGHYEGKKPNPTALLTSSGHLSIFSWPFKSLASQSAQQLKNTS